jgi:hypothetical protein
MNTNEEEVKTGQVWEYVGDNVRSHGEYVVVSPNIEGALETPGSWKMRRLTDEKIGYMHRSARMAKEWVRP